MPVILKTAGFPGFRKTAVAPTEGKHDRYTEYRHLSPYMQSLSDEYIDEYIKNYYATTKDRMPGEYKAINGLLSQDPHDGDGESGGIRLKGMNPRGLK